MHPLVAALLGVVEGLTEFLPISSTAHLILASKALHVPETEFLKTFEICIQLGAILAVVVLYGQRLIVDRRLLALIMVAFLPTAIIGFFAHGLVKAYLLESVTTVLWALFLGGIALIVFDRVYGRRTGGTRVLSMRQAFIIGCCQSIAIIPGVSRAAATIVGGELLGVERKAIVEFSFLLAIPTMMAATGFDLLTSADQLASADWLALAIGFAVAFVISLVSIRWFLAFIQKHSFATFGIYRIALAIVCWLFLL